MTVNLVMLQPNDATTRSWATELAQIDGLEVHVPESRADSVRALETADAAYGTLDRGLLAAAPRLRWLQAPMAAPPAGYFFKELVRHPVVVTNFRGIYNDHVATHAVSLVLALSRGLHRYLHQQMRADWTRHLEDSAVLHLQNARAVVVGVGGIGAEIGRMLHAFGVTVVGVDPQRAEPPPGFTQVVAPDRLDDLLPDADIVVLTLPHTPQSEGLIDRDRLAKVPPHCILVNIGRGATVSLDAVVEALDAGRLGGVGLDVFEVEPLPVDHKLWLHPQAILTPHVAVVGPHIDERRFAVVRENAQRFAADRPLVNTVNKELWY